MKAITPPTAFIRAAAGFLLAAALSACAAQPKVPQVGAEAPKFDPSDSERLAVFVPPSGGRAARRPTSRDLLGLSGDSVRGLMGSPGLVRKEAPAEVWQYLSNRCSLLVYLYPDGNTPRVRHAETLARARNTNVADEDCMNELVKGTPPVS